MSITSTYNNSDLVVTLTSETAYTLPSIHSRSSLILKNASSSDVVVSAFAGEEVDGVVQFVLGGYKVAHLIRNATQWVNLTSNPQDLAGDLTGPMGNTTTTGIGLAFTNQPANDRVEIVSASAADTSQNITIIGTTTGTDTVVVETVRLTGTAVASTSKVDWGVILAVKLDASCAGTVTVREASGNATITAGLTTGVLSVGVETVAAADQEAYGKVVALVADGATTKQLGLKGTNTTGDTIYDSQALNGATSVNSNSSFYTLTEIYTGDIESSRTVTATASGLWTISAGSFDFKASGASALAIDSSGVATFADATDSTSITTGSVHTAGGVGVGKALWVGGLANVAGVATLANAMDAASSTDAGTIVSGGLAVAKKANVGTDLAVGGNATITGNLTAPVMLGNVLLGKGSVTLTEGTITLAGLDDLAALDTAIADGGNFGNQPTNDAVDLVSDDEGDTTQTATIIGTTNGTDTVVAESIALDGTTPVTTSKADWGIILAVKLSASCAGTITIREASGDATITTILTTVLSAGVTAVVGADQVAYGRKLFAVAGGASTKQIGFYGTNTSDAAVYDSQALNGTTKVQSNTAFRTVTELYHGDIATGTSATVSSDNRLIIPAASINFSGLPTASTGLSTGDLWTNSNVLTIA